MSYAGKADLLLVMYAYNKSFICSRLIFIKKKNFFQKEIPYLF